MIIAEKKPFEEIKGSLFNKYKKVLVVGCKGCVAVCLAGGEKETNLLASELELAAKAQQLDIVFEKTMMDRQCDMEFLEEIEGRINQYDAVLSLACGAGVQFMAEKYPSKPVVPAVNTTFIGVNKAMGVYEERCRACGTCVLDTTAGICPVTMCSKSIYNGPCGGTNQTSCEVDPNQPCAWHMIYTRLSEQGRLENILEVKPANEWVNTTPRDLTQPGYETPNE
jgi:ferredoxin